MVALSPTSLSAAALEVPGQAEGAPGRGEDREEVQNEGDSLLPLSGDQMAHAEILLVYQTL